MARKKKFQTGGRPPSYNPMLHMTNPAEAERQRIAGNKAARKRRMPTKEQDRYWWSGLTRPVDEVLRKSLGPAASSFQGVLDLFTPARSIAEVANKPTAGNIIDAAADTALTAGGLKALAAPTKVAQKVKRKTPGGDDMSKYKVAESLFGKAKDALTKGKGTPKSKTPTVSKTAGSERSAGDFGETGVMKGIDKQWNKGAAKQRAATPKPDIIAHVGSRNTVATNRANRAAKKASTPKTATSPTSAPVPKKPVTPKVNKPKTPPKTPKAETPKKPTSGKSTPKRVVDIAKTAVGAGTRGRRSGVAQRVSKVEDKLGLGKKGQLRGMSKKDQQIAENIRTGAKGLGKAALVGGTLYGGKELYDMYSKEAGATPKSIKKAEGSKATINKAPYVEGYDMDMDDFDSAKPIPSKPKAKPKATAKATPKAKAKAKTDPDFEYYGKEGTGLGDFSRKHGIQYATDKGYKKWFEHDGEKAGGRPGKGKMKTQGMNRSKRTGFSGRGAGAALRGF